MNRVLLIIVLLVLFGCKSAMNVKSLSELKILPALSDNTSVVVFNEGKKIPDSISKEKLGEFKIRDGGATVDCSLKTVLNIAKSRARSIGGNVVKITRQISPRFSTCFQIDFEVFKIDNVTPFEKSFLWNSNRELVWEDFKDAPKISLPFYVCAYIDAYFDFTKYFSKKGKFEVNAEFNAQCSSVQPSERNKNGLKLANIHFDLTKIYADKIRLAFQKKQLYDFESWKKYANEIYSEYNKEYETEIYNLYNQTSYGTNISELISWKFKVNQELKNTID
ncbi:hypothetical protein MNBD_BACTEROID02-1260 [hydrothermal vent metagenome]|jgi:hypothetical protein|uniref:Lipoprotein n=1 Tax=hydrothermal vent metagenome TaxID=652676 RepID=A0A3B0RP59_9ZZZZ